MKKRILIACTMQTDMIQNIIKNYHAAISVDWISRKLHMDVKKLNKSIQEHIHRHQEADEILLSYGLCGNAVLGLHSDRTKLILPAFDDCMNQILCGTDHRQLHRDKKYTEKGCYYLTREWTIDQEAIVQQCEQIYRSYGREEGQQIINEIYSGYHSLVFIDTGVYDIHSLQAYAEKASEYTGMCVKIQKGSCSILEKLILGNYDENFAVFHPGEVIERNKIFCDR